MANTVFLLACALVHLLAYFSVAYAAIVEHSFHVQNLAITQLCHQQVITAVNGSLPGPIILVNEGDTLVVHVINNSPYNVSIHWHGVMQLRSAWADGPAYVTQCPISPETSYTYRFTITGQEGTLFWHAHYKWLRATVYGAIIIRPRKDHSYPFKQPHKEFPIIFGEWWNASVLEVEDQALASGGAPNISNAFTINGQPGDLYPCSSNGTHKLKFVQGETYLLRIINAALNGHFFFKIANHNMMVVAVDACYTTPLLTDVVVIAPGQTVDVLVTANQPPGSYYMAASPYESGATIAFDNTTTTAIITYENATSSTPLMPVLPAFNDTPTAFKFYSNLTGLINGPYYSPVPKKIDENMFVTEGLGLISCGQNETCSGPLGLRFAGSMNNASLQLPTKLSILQAFFNNVSGIYTTDFPDIPPVIFDYTNQSNNFNTSIVMTSKSTKVKTFKFNTTVQIVFQNTALVMTGNHPIHLHGHNFFIVGQGFGVYDPVIAPQTFNLINPQVRNTAAVPVAGWAAIRFTTNNPGVWFVHCHLDTHLSWGFAAAFAVENGPTPSTTLPHPPSDLPRC